MLRPMAVYKSSEGYNDMVRPILADIYGREDEATPDAALYEQELIRARDLTSKLSISTLKKELQSKTFVCIFRSTRVFMLN